MHNDTDNHFIMKSITRSALAAAMMLAAGCSAPQEKAITLTQDEIQEIAAKEGKSVQDVLFDDGNYAMFIHFGLYSKLEGEWKGKAYYGNAEWIMNENQAGIPVDEYMAEAATFNPSEFNADEIVGLAKDAGMKYIIITSKHHEGFAMFKSDACDFNIADATPFGRDLIGELAESCHRNGIGIGFYYSQFQDWTAPGGGRGPQTDAEGRPVSFEEYFRAKCVPQVEEITTKYGDIELIWFDTPAEMGAEYSRELVDIVKKNQPNALVSSRVGNGMGDYETLGDMEVPAVNTPGRWEGIDVTQVGWGFSKADHRFKTPEYVLKTLVSTVARGGTFMMNVGPDKTGKVVPEAADALRKAGEWVKRHPRAIYMAEPSPWLHSLAWGDAVVNSGKVYLTIFDWPSDGKLYVPGVRNAIKSVRIDGGRKLKFSKEGSWLCIDVPVRCPDEMAGVVELTPEGELDIDSTAAVDPVLETIIPIESAKVEGAEVIRAGWMENFGEWRTKANARMSEGTVARWTVDIVKPGFYDLNLEYRSADRHEWRATVDGTQSIEHNCGSSSIYSLHPLGWIRIDEPGKHEIEIRQITGADNDVELGGLCLTRVNM